MAGNSSRRGAVRKPGSKKGPVVGSGGQKRQGLEGKGPTPKATERTKHVAAKRAGAASKRASAGGGGRTTGATRGGRATRRPAGAPEYVGGRNPVVEALRAGVPVRALYVASQVQADERVKEAVKIAGEMGLPILEVSKVDLDRMTSDGVHQGVAIQVPAYDYAHPDDLLDLAYDAGAQPLLVALDGVTDPRNLGAVVRSVAAFGGHGVVVPERRAAGMTASAWKVSAGAAARIRVARATNLTRALVDLQKAGCFVVGLAADGDLPLDELEAATGPVVIVVGSEGKGLSRLVRETCDVTVTIPMAGAMESLNAGVAAGVALYEVARRRAAE
ncbi:23S rRNA (guanosine(2251)-2'-O)-methyltransferase RlmB [Kineosporia sp. A_224]|uniref:23S rRNA (guanosine(2251)-2'-O)-methyltransferase RlmB n=1 Tax=Kineosporia sp. A_224 TaxID=1962180 RepID=UPI000B4B5EA2|nr:23S rRNA (guanosine(2251)-2'-O)-methyltransferase RlmB [Kineosporia sp. A_224]